jgi:hydroxyacylglutathione hydrolase
MIFPILALDDNYIWLLQESDTLVLVDPGAAEPLLDWFAVNSWQPSAILITHTHHDHIGGVAQLLAHYPNVCVYASEAARSQIPVTHPVTVGQCLSIGGWQIEVMDLAGHTPDHLGYYLKDQHSLFCGDALFSGGCGRLFNGGTAEQMTESLARIAQLPADTLLYPAHEYTLANLRFAQMVEPNNPDITQRLAQVQMMRRNAQVTLPTHLALELAINPFLRTDLPQVHAAIEQWAAQAAPDAVTRFAQLRAWKDQIDRTGVLELPI